MNKVPARLLIVDDEESLMHALCNILQQQGYATTGRTCAADALAAMHGETFDLLLTDMTMPGTDGLALVRAALAHDPSMVAVMMTGQGSIDSAVQAMQSGVLDYVLKPFKLSNMLPVIERALAIRRLRCENAALHAQLVTRTVELETANRELEAYAAMVSHDLRAPLRGIDGLAQALQTQLRTVLTADTQRLLDLIGSRARRAQRLVEDLLRLSRVGRAPLVLVEVDVARLARAVADEIASTGAATPADLVVSPEMPQAIADLQLLRQILVNLLSNAFKFSNGQAHPRIEVGGYLSNDCRVFYVRDNGPGFDMRHSGKLFLPFQRLQGAERFDGSGVGLSIVQRIVQRHSGHVWASAAIGQGACFSFTLDPCSPAASPDVAH